MKTNLFTLCLQSYLIVCTSNLIYAKNSDNSEMLHVKNFKHKLISEKYIHSKIKSNNSKILLLPGNIAPNGTGYQWSDIPLSSSSSDVSKTENKSLIDGDLATDVMYFDASANGNWQAAGITWASPQSGITSVRFYNGKYDMLSGNGFFSSGIKLQYSVDGINWIDATGWNMSPTYSYTSASTDQMYIFNGTALNNVKGIRVIGKVRTNDSWAVYVKEVEVYTTSTVGGTIPVSNLSLTPAAAGLQTGFTVVMTPTFTPANATNKTVTYASSNNLIATVNTSGVVTGLAYGTAIITGTSADGKIGTSTITVSRTGTTIITNTNTLLNFNSNPTTFLANPYNDPSGYTIAGAGPNGVPDPIEVISLGGNNLIKNKNFSSTTTITRTNGAIFDISSLSYASDPWGGLADATITGYYPTGTIVSTSISSASTTLSLKTLGWFGIKKIVIDYSGGVNNSYGMLDNFLFSTSVSGARAVKSSNSFVLNTSKSNNDLVIYPNPAKTLASFNYFTQGEGKVQIHVINAQGTLIKQVLQPLVKGNNTIKVDINSLQNGMYMVKVINGNSVVTRKLIVNK